MLTRRYRVTVLTLFLSLCSFNPLFAQTTSAPGAPGKDAHWPTAAKTGFGTANTTASKVWFTLADGVMTEVYYPRLDNPNTECLQLIVCTNSGCQTEADMLHEVRHTNAFSLSFQQINTPSNGRYAITKSYTVDPARPTVLISVAIAGEFDDVYVYFDPSLNNSGMHDNARTFADALIASDGNVGTALVANTPLNEITNGFRGTADGLTQLQKTGGLTELYSEATNGNVVQVARLQQPQKFTLALGFGAEPTEALVNARFSILKGFDKTNREYERTWRNYLAGLRRVKWRYQRQFNMAAMVLKGLEDKTYRGAIIASPSIPWGGGANANEATISGYHAVWPRDLYQVATALYLAGDRATANRSLDYLLNIQRPDGSFPQNCWVNGTPIGNGLQLDQVALPIVLAHQLRRFDRTTWIRHIKPAADFVIRHGPSTKQERWEEESGYSPSTIGAEIAGLICASDIARIHRDKKAADKYLRTADDWSDSVVKWTATSNGPAGDGKYFLRITEKGNPDEGSKIEINSGGGTFDQREIVDAGFLELVRLGIKNADDPLILKSLAMIDKLIKVETPVGPGWYRYNHDAYGERPDGVDYDGRSGKGRLWTLLTGERAEFELAHKNVSEAMKLLDTLSNFANEGLMLPEQVWDGSGPSNVKPGKGTGSATPLAWSMAQFMRLAINVQNGRNLDTPLIVRNRYASR